MKVFFWLIGLFYVSSYFIYQYGLQFFHEFMNVNMTYGFAFLQGFFLTFVVLFMVFVRHHKRLLSLLDGIIMALLPALLCYEFFCLLTHARLGRVTSLPIGISPTNYMDTALFDKRHPIHLYGVLMLAVMNGMLFKLRRYSAYRGILFLMMMPVVMLGYFVLEFLRGDVYFVLVKALSFNQVFLMGGFLVIVIGMPILIYRLAVKEEPLYSIKSIFKLTESAHTSSHHHFLKFMRQFILIFFLLGFTVLIPHPYWVGNPLAISDAGWLLDTGDDHIVVNVPSKTLYYEGLKYPVSVGKIDRQTPIGVGRVVSKRKTIHFIYTEGPKKGNVIWHARDFKGRLFEVPYDRMRGLGLRINGLTDYVIHSTTEDWNIGRAVSSGCIRMTIPDMLELFDQVERNTTVVIDYILSEVVGSDLIVYEDVYRLKHCIVNGRVVNTKAYLMQDVIEKTGKKLIEAKIDMILKKPLRQKQVIPLGEITY